MICLHILIENYEQLKNAMKSFIQKMHLHTQKNKVKLRYTNRQGYN